MKIEVMKISVILNLKAVKPQFTKKRIDFWQNHFENDTIITSNKEISKTMNNFFINHTIDCNRHCTIKGFILYLPALW